MLYRFSGNFLLGVFFATLLSSCSITPNLTQAQKQSANSLPTATVNASPEDKADTPEQVVKKYAEIGLRQDLKFEEKEKQVEECCLAKVEQDLPLNKQANVEYLKKKNPAGIMATGIGLLYDELLEVKIRCRNEQESVVDATFQVKGKKQQSTDYFILTKQNNKWLVKDVSVLEIPKCAS